jgi:NAD(P)-dependent dehydrogenase (short-subunit alcohol dehydrogenase family)
MTTALITGANRGIGLELCKALKARGDQVIAVCRKPSKELEALGVRIESGVDVTDDRAAAELGKKITGTIDLLIHNAGILTHENIEGLDAAAVRKQLEVNAVGPLVLTSALLPRLGRGSKIAILTSRMGSMADNGSGGYYGYRMSKAALNAAGVSLARDLRPRGIAVALLHPGFVRTNMTGGNGNVEPADAARDLLKRIDELNLENSGRFWHASGEELPW